MAEAQCEVSERRELAQRAGQAAAVKGASTGQGRGAFEEGLELQTGTDLDAQVGLGRPGINEAMTDAGLGDETVTRRGPALASIDPEGDVAANHLPCLTLAGV